MPILDLAQPEFDQSGWREPRKKSGVRARRDLDICDLTHEKGQQQTRNSRRGVNRA